jgi:hypothetical protein
MSAPGAGFADLVAAVPVSVRRPPVGAPCA